MQIGEFTYKIVRNPPLLTKLSIALIPIVGCPVIPSCDWKNDGLFFKKLFIIYW